MALVLPHSGAVVLGGWVYDTITVNDKVYLRRFLPMSIGLARKVWNETGQISVEVHGVHKGNLKYALMALNRAREMVDEQSGKPGNWKEVHGVCRNPNRLKYVTSYRTSTAENVWRNFLMT